MSSPEASFEQLPIAKLFYPWTIAERLSDFHWVTNRMDSYRAVLSVLPSVFAWNEAGPVLEDLHTLARSVGMRRVRSLFGFISQYDAGLSHAMETCFEELQPPSQARFAMAPETGFRIRQLRKTPFASITALATYLNAEEVLQSSDRRLPSASWSALGDFYCPASADRLGAAIEFQWIKDRPFVGPSIAGSIAIDFVSPNVQHTKEITIENQYQTYSQEEAISVCKKIEDALARISSVSPAAANVVKRCIKTIVPFKQPQGCGSTSERCMPGVVILPGVSNGSPARIASQIIHEAIHQFLYVLEYEGNFVVTEPPQQVKSLWTGRELQLHSYFHACFVWYGLAHFWALAVLSDKFNQEECKNELGRAINGFRSKNPIDELGNIAGNIRSDVCRIAATLRNRLLDMVPSTIA